MYKLALVNMPFAALNTPSIGLTQLKSVVDLRLKERVFTEVFYLNMDFAHYVGIALYQYIAFSMEGHIAGLGEWFFRRAAFPQVADNAAEYFSRYYLVPDKRTEVIKHALLRKREGTEAFLDSLIDRYRLDQADLVGFTSMFSQNLACFAMAGRLKERNPAIVTVMGGANCLSPMGQAIVKQMPQIDFVFSGAALKSFPEFVQKRSEQRFEDCQRIPGVFSKTIAPAVRRGPTPEPDALAAGADPRQSKCVGEDLDINANLRLDYRPYLDAFESNFSGEKMKPMLLFETSRGCWWGERCQCGFCGLDESTLRHRAMSPDNAIAQIQSMFQYSPRFSYLSCVDDVMPKRYFQEVLPHLNPPAETTIFYEVKVPLREEEMQALSRAGIRVIQPGIEALATSTLRLMRKGTTAFQNLRLLKSCLQYNVYPLWNLLVGFPGEAEAVYEKYARDLPLLVHLPPPTGVHTIRVDRYSPIFNQAGRYGFDLHPSDFYEMVYPFPEEVLEQLAYFFVDHNYDAPHLVAVCKWIDRLRAAWGRWWGCWYGDEQASPPKLFLKPGGAGGIVFDSRSGEAVDSPVDLATRQVLDSLNTPKRMAELAQASGLSQDELARIFGLLCERGWVFEEDGQFLSLVLPREPPAMNSHVLEYFIRLLKGNRTGRVEGESI